MTQQRLARHIPIFMFQNDWNAGIRSSKMMATYKLKNNDAVNNFVGFLRRKGYKMRARRKAWKNDEN